MHSIDHRRSFVARTVSVLLAGAGFCVTGVQAQSGDAAPGSAATGSSAAAGVSFIDIPKFDRDLYAALTGKSDPVSVTFYDQVSPNKMPERLQKWISTVEKSGGTIDIEPPPNEPVPKSPLLLIGLIGSLWSAIKAFNEIKEESVFRAASKRNVVIVLDRDANRQVVVTRLTFLPRSP